MNGSQTGSNAMAFLMSIGLSQRLDSPSNITQITEIIDDLLLPTSPFPGVREITKYVLWVWFPVSCIINHSDNGPSDNLSVIDDHAIP